MPTARNEPTTLLPPSSYRNERGTRARRPSFLSAAPAASSGSHPPTVVADADVSMGGVSFTQLILNALHGHESIKAYSRTIDNDVREQEARLTQEDLYTLPANAGELLGQFFTLRHPLSPVFHAPSIRPLFDAALHCPPEQRSHHKSIFVLLNMIFAICTSHWVIDPQGNPRAARRHYDIAISLIQPDLLRDWRLEHVQALLIGARYLQGSSCANECWNILGLAIRIAYGLGLHKDPPDTDPHPLRETKRRVWYAAYTLDVLLSMIYDRPSMIRSDECSVGLPADLDDEYIQSAPMPRPPSSMSFSIEVIKLYRIIEAFKSKLNSGVDSGRKVVELVMPLDEQHRKWYRSLPSHLILDYKAPKEQPWILALRGNMVKILIHRQSLMVSLRGLSGEQDVENSVVTHALQSSRDICINAAMESIDMVALRHEHTKNTMGLNWFNIYYLFNAVIVLVSHVIEPAHNNDRAALTKVDTALRMIQAMSHDHAFAQRAYTFLQQLLGYMHPSVTAAAQRNQNQDETSFSSRPPLHTEQTAGQLPTDLQHNGADSIPSLHTLYGFTQDLTDNLVNYLENLDNSGFADEPWVFQ
ncbi:uncharacterized protein Z520_04930 [Fonsecaea multimorphosa CBS 102226]|uniref:Xylanolytic transcriptional activator regulatory domain-containing protein n=1 Tax=Fonsecaea multimorphosa CBS 102226 TaxID=1442371 RepID=A0A0D2K892_9EURO|nr:uncharacterized protein Z520_04930 [Fonsecaea multimorphosa CBS 102226]KIX99354.1 hypothetical protein Z520_04930 [Fonsecaea multimorphosa CBS 102226]OAL25685.1 hypothetical protein AYO22_04674 [Fonsecaea multimorphosa]